MMRPAKPVVGLTGTNVIRVLNPRGRGMWQGIQVNVGAMGRRVWAHSSGIPITRLMPVWIPVPTIPTNIMGTPLRGIVC